MSSGQERITALLHEHPIISGMITRRQLEIVLSHLHQVLEAQVHGAVVELGCCMGTTSLFIRRLLDARESRRRFIVYDSFLGLPAKRAEDESLDGSIVREGSCKCEREVLLANFHQAGLRPPEIREGWFRALPARSYPESIAFAFLDGDFYQSIWDSLNIVYPRLSRGGVIVMHDYSSLMLPGVERACSEFLRGKAEEGHVTKQELIGAFHKR
ncbi:TylF/MycF/NovP-related O-methyltransferase [Thiorhodovibrio frisius]|uniref:Putative O-methyltransferase n=1 Tax=Thiorhodovibrio frisius TaxID=631362 RepID=H8Z1M4_9GAMM|nr:TylF/MycF/NovP-related O-methyltransferase [Thiorhodovibrio frisius]EIC21469.1 putative O-methyltransferase [Thiorhodovibrio frisius]WPL24055.1 Macrocin O-methyltransferase [Thiorhodovibrio frisius]